MRRRETVLHIAVFLATIVMVVAATVIGPLLTQPGLANEPLSYPEYNVSEIVPERSAVGGSPQPVAARDRGLVVIDHAHANRFKRTEIQPLVAAINDAGYRVEFATGSDIQDVLSRADAYVVINPGRRFSESEVDAVENFVDSGGRVALLAEPTQSQISGFGLRTVTNRMAPLSTRFGIEFGTGYLFNMARHDGTFQNIYATPAGQVSPSDNTPLVGGIDRTTFYTATHVSAEAGTPILTAIEGTRSSRSDRPHQYVVAAVSRQGRVLAVGDTTFLVRGNYNVLDNDVFVANIAEFLVRGDRTRNLLDYPYTVDQHPTIRYTSIDLLEASKDVAMDLRKEGKQPRVILERDTIPARKTDVLVTTFGHLRNQGISGPGTGITLRKNRVAVRGFESATSGVVMVHMPQHGIDLVIVANTTIEAEQAVELLTEGRLAQHVITNSTAVLDNSPSSRISNGETKRPTGNQSSNTTSKINNSRAIDHNARV